jgi:hypothetical protein
VVLIAVISTFVIWDVARNDSRFIRKAERFVARQIESWL